MALKNIIADFINTVKGINRKYADPALKTGAGVKFSLLCLRIYLILLVGLLFFKFFTTLKR